MVVHSILPSVFQLNDIPPSVYPISVIFLTGILLSVIPMSVIFLIVILLNVVAPSIVVEPSKTIPVFAHAALSTDTPPGETTKLASLSSARNYFLLLATGQLFGTNVFGWPEFTCHPQVNDWIF